MKRLTSFDMLSPGGVLSNPADSSRAAAAAHRPADRHSCFAGACWVTNILGGNWPSQNAVQKQLQNTDTIRKYNTKSSVIFFEGKLHAL